MEISIGILAFLLVATVAVGVYIIVRLQDKCKDKEIALANKQAELDFERKAMTLDRKSVV